MPAGRAARPRSPPTPAFYPGRAATSGRAGAQPARAPGRRNAWQPLSGAILSGRGAAQPRWFRLFPGPWPATIPGPRLPVEWGWEGHVAGRRVAAAAGGGGTLRPGPGPGGAQRRSGPTLSAKAWRLDY